MFGFFIAFIFANISLDGLVVIHSCTNDQNAAKHYFELLFCHNFVISFFDLITKMKFQPYFFLFRYCVVHINHRTNVETNSPHKWIPFMHVQRRLYYLWSLFESITMKKNATKDSLNDMFSAPVHQHNIPDSNNPLRLGRCLKASPSDEKKNIFTKNFTAMIFFSIDSLVLHAWYSCKRAQLSFVCFWEIH